MSSRATFLVIFILLASYSVVVQRTLETSETKLYVDPSSVVDEALVPGSTFDVDISVLEVADLYCWGFKLSWDPAVLEVTNVLEGDFLDQGTYNTIFQPYYYNDLGYIMVVCTLQGEPRSASASGNGTLAIVTFSVEVEGGTTLHLYNTQLRDYDNSEIPHVTEDGYFSNFSGVERHDIAVLDVTVFPDNVTVGAAISINVTIKNEGNRPENFNVSVYYDSNVIDMRTNVHLSPEDSSTLNFTWNTTSVSHDLYTINAQVPPVPGENDTSDNTYSSITVTLKLPDFNNDEKVNVFDLSALGKAWTTTMGHPDYNAAVDFNNDGKIDSEDFHLLTINWGYGS